MLQESFREFPPPHPALPWMWISLHSHVLWTKEEIKQGKSCTVQCRNAVCDAQLSPGFGWDLGGAGLEMEHLGVSFV